MSEILNLREQPMWLERAADYFSTRWSIDRALYLESMNDSLTTARGVPRWYLMLCDQRIIGGFGLIENDFMVRTDLCPWLCALYVEESERGRHLGGEMLFHARREAMRLGFPKLWLNTDHVGYYEKYGWRYLGDFPHQEGTDARVYEADAASPLEKPEEMAAFFNTRADTYDHHMLDDLGLAPFYETVADCVKGRNILDLGCGTGLELERLFAADPNVAVTGVDFSPGMLARLSDKYPEKNLRLICGSYFDVDFAGAYDCAISTYSLHHFSEEKKRDLYRKIFEALKPGGLFVWGDYTVPNLARQHELTAQGEALARMAGDSDEVFYHFDVPFTVETETGLLTSAGFSKVNIIKRWENAAVITAVKE